MKVRAFRKDGTEVVGCIKPPIELQLELMMALNGNKKVMFKKDCLSTYKIFNLKLKEDKKDQIEKI